MSNLLDVKRSSVSRTLKEYEIYLKEFEGLQSKLDTLKERGNDHETKKTLELCNESESVLNDTKGRLFNYAIDLESYIKEESDVLDSKGLEMAKESLLTLSKRHPQVGYTFGL
ncbi:hypothetical protein BEWA_006950 [Theileria equi strain WA]|uniref:Tubulin-specific chaperone A n=1 Tax=Theileria equi strain WA TaxID=1537102 RepID=L0B212_THEEQ|nr:hypothetical protein BEWA_006950 [Theileria equi strain WA]AFZ81286.1 hypothetical protein BEWA_006950 [Theileria equi strain WA]|eukprot:XP_004830952.1 hypothetical protein BEWA_006950 [Theileria equi strain WA]